MESLIEESKKARRRGWIGFFKQRRVLILLVLAFLFGTGAFYFFKNDGQAESRTAAPKEWTVRTGDIRTAVTADGKVVAREGVELSFAVSGDSLEVDTVFVKEGESVKKGDKIASVKTEALSLNLRSAYSSYQSALANYNERIAGATEDEKAKAQSAIDQAKISLDQTKISLEKTKTSAADKIADAEDALATARENLDKNQAGGSESDLRQAYNTLVDTIKALNLNLETMMPALDAIIGADNVSLNDSFEGGLGVKTVSSLGNAQRSYLQADMAINVFEIFANSLSYSSPYTEIEIAAGKAEEVLNAMNSHLLDMQIMLDASVVSTDLSQTRLDGFKSTVNTDRTAINTRIASLEASRQTILDRKSGLSDFQKAYDNAAKNLKTAMRDAEQDIKNAETNVSSRELSLAQAEQTYRELIAPLSASETASANTSLTSASISLQRAQLEMDKATLVSPIDGVVAALNYAAGDIILQSNSSAKAVATILNKDTLYIEVNVEEADISKLQVGQKAKAVFDAVDELELEGEISFISLTSSSNQNGIVTYLVRVIFMNPEASPIREGMTATVDFVISGVSDVLTAPVAAVRNVEGKPSVQFASGEWAPVTTGYTDGQTVEIIGGVREGERILY